MLVFLQRSGLIGMLIFNLVCLNAQQSISSFDTYLISKLDNYNTPRSGDLGLKFYSPWIEDYDFRTETDEFDFDRQEYVFRISPSSPTIRKYQKKVFSDLKTEYDLKLNSKKDIFLKEAYDNWLDLYFDYQHLEKLKSLIPVYEDLIFVLSKEEKDGSVNVFKLIEINKIKLKLEAQIEEISSNNSWNSEPLIDSLTLINPDEIQLIISKIDLTAYDYRDLGLDKQELISIENKYALEKAEKNKMLDFAQAKYNGPDDDPWAEKFSLGLAFRLQRGGKSKLDMIELELERKLVQDEIYRKKLEFQNEVEVDKIQLNSALVELKKLEELKQKFATITQMALNIEPKNKSEIVELLKLRIEDIEQEISILKSKRDLYENYVEYLSRTGILHALPLKNYLSPEIEPLGL